MGGREAFDRVVGALESITAAGEAKDRRSNHGASTFTDRSSRQTWFDHRPRQRFGRLAEHALAAFTALGTYGRKLVVVRVLDPQEVSFSFSGHVRLRAMEGNAVVETNADEVRATYQARLHAIAERYSDELTRRGGRFVDTSTDKPADEAVRAVVRAVSEARA